MKEKALNLLGLMRKANAIAVGETNTGTTVRAGKAKLMLIASDASENAVRRANGFVTGKSTMLVMLPFTKDEVSTHVGVSGCSMAAVTDIGFANAFMKILASQWPAEYEKQAEEMKLRNEKAQRRKAETAAHERNKRNGKRRTNA